MTITQDMIDRVRADFPLITEDVAYLDNSATSQKPQSVIEAGKRFYETENANPLRGLYRLSVAATETYEQAREAVRAFIGAGSTEEIIFTRNATESLNLGTGQSEGRRRYPRHRHRAPLEHASLADGSEKDRGEPPLSVSG